ncbi:nitric oxide reductase transcriptional regulator NorR [Motiliproteus coralliicola]|uniref:Nitric oxide reductase transcriptional regulator NorR n=1 Tax=Motiliproteus coralliicola TaxID=2283196 RepID=A0A369WU44_9GAMM|nr:nitric oxide reductase transcriptional regulator NorR [Motiliproteus coralliicola]RDE23025.1 nitric oxide reductase transcriptional regulator NorR [Motiliproteus coralliicola]
MTSNFFRTLTTIVADLSRDIPAEQRYRQLLDAIVGLFPCDAAALLKLEGTQLRPLAFEGLTTDTLGRRFEVAEHPRLQRLLHSRQPVRFEADSRLPDPYDGLVEDQDMELHVHDCMGASLYIDDKPWGVLTLDAMDTGTFDNIDDTELRTVISLTEATVKAAARMDALAAKAEHQLMVTKALLDEKGAGAESEMIGSSDPMTELKQEISVVAQSHLSVLVEGETGVGKEVVARRIHFQSQRSQGPLVQINCAALPENIAESELFGHIRGAFSGASADRAGKFEIADGGTLFLDEIGELSLSIQAKLLRALQSGEIQRVGRDKPLRVDVRIVAATNRDLQQEVNAGRFRADLYHRLSVYPLSVPPLRERGKDILLLAGYALEADQRRLRVQGLRLSEEAKQNLLNYPWPGNVRELNHLLSRAALRAISSQGRDRNIIIIRPNHLGLDASDLGTAQAEAAPSAESQEFIPAVSLEEATNLKDATDLFQRRLIEQVLIHHRGNQAAAARQLGLHRSNFYRLLQRLGLKE